MKREDADEQSRGVEKGSEHGNGFIEAADFVIETQRRGDAEDAEGGFHFVTTLALC